MSDDNSKVRLLSILYARIIIQISHMTNVEVARRMRAARDKFDSEVSSKMDNPETFLREVSSPGHV